MTVLEAFTCSTFAPRVSERFRLVRDGPEPMDMVLIEATELPMASPQPGRTPFSIVFLGPGPAVLPQATYRLEHPDLGAFDLFLVPIARDGDGVRYQAIFA